MNESDFEIQILKDNATQSNNSGSPVYLNHRPSFATILQNPTRSFLSVNSQNSLIKKSPKLPVNVDALVNHVVSSLKGITNFQSGVINWKVDLPLIYTEGTYLPREIEIDGFARVNKIEHLLSEDKNVNNNAIDTTRKPVSRQYSVKPKLDKNIVAKKHVDFNKKNFTQENQGISEFDPALLNFKELIVQQEMLPKLKRGNLQEIKTIALFAERRVVNKEVNELYVNAVRRDSAEMVLIERKNLINLQDVVFPMKDLYMRVNNAGQLNQMPKSYSCKEKAISIPFQIKLPN